MRAGVIQLVRRRTRNGYEYAWNGFAALPAGVTSSSGVETNAAIDSFATALRARVASTIPLHVTSGVRTATAQARALVTKRAQAGDAGVRALYGQKDLIDEILAVPATTEAMAKVLYAQMARGRFLSRHMRGDAFDLRRTNLTQEQAQIVNDAAKAMGAKPLIEDDPPHIHIEKVGGGYVEAAQGAATSALDVPMQAARSAVRTAPLAVAFSVAGGGLLALLLLRRLLRAPVAVDAAAAPAG